MKYFKYKDEYEYCSELSDYLKSELPEIGILSNKLVSDYKIDFILFNKDNKKPIFIEVKGNSKNIPLPNATIIELELLKTENNCEVILISLVPKNELLEDKLNKVGVFYLIKPDFSEVKNKIKELM